MLVCLLALLIPHGGHGTVSICVLFFPVFLFGLLALEEWFGAPGCADGPCLPQFPCLSALFQRPPPSFE
jgi:hypothetical protein